MPMVDEDYSEPSPPKCFKMRRRCCGRFYCTLWCFRRKTDRLNFAVLVIGVVSCPFLNLSNGDASCEVYGSYTCWGLSYL